MTDATIEMPDGRTLGYGDYGNAGDVPVLWCHGGPGSRMEAKLGGPAATARGFRLVGIDRPGYGLSTPRPGRSIESCVPDILAVADAVGADAFYVVGVSTGGAYAAATAAIAPERVLGAVLACALTDMRDERARKAMTTNTPELAAIWSAATRDDAIAAGVEQFGEDGKKLFGGANELQATGAERGITGKDAELFADPAFLAGMLESLPPMFAWGVEGYADDRRADGDGWGGFDVSAITCPVIVAHGDSDTIVPVETASVTAEVIPGAQLRVFEQDGHFSIVRHVPDLLAELRGMSAVIVERDKELDGLVTITLNRPEKLNALNVELHDALQPELVALETDPTARVVVLTGAGRAFSAGADLQDRRDTKAVNDIEKLQRAHLGGRTTELIDRLPQVVIAQINGLAVGGAVVFLTACDMRLAAESAWLSIPEVELGMPLTWQAIPRLMRELGPARTKELVMACDRFSAQQAYEWGFVNHVYPDDQLAPETRKLAEKLLSMDPLSLSLTKAACAAAANTMVTVDTNWADAEVMLHTYRRLGDRKLL